MTSTEDLLNAFMNRTATADDRAELAGRLKALDDTDAELLEQFEAESLIERTAEPSPDLDAHFDAVWERLGASAPDNVVSLTPKPRPARSFGWLGVPIAVAAAGLLFFALPETSTKPQTDMYLKGTAAPSVELQAFAGTQSHTKPGIEKPLESGARIAADTPVLLAYRLSSPAWVYVLTETDQGPQIVHRAGHRSVGRHEVAQEGRILSLTLRRLDTQTLRIELLAAPQALEPSWLESLNGLDDPRLTSECIGCGRHGLLLRTKPSP